MLSLGAGAISRGEGEGALFFNSSQLQPLGQGAGLCGWSDGPQRQTVGLTPKLCQSGPHGVRRTASLLHGP